jgi:hypothetical protein
MNRVPTVVLVVGLALAVLTGSAFAFADFGAAQSATSVQSGVSTSATSDATVDLSDGVYVYVAGETVADREFEAELVETLRAEGIDASSVSEIRPTYDRPVLLVGHSAWNLNYTPVRADASVDWTFLYVQTGNISQFGQTTFHSDDFAADRVLDRLTGEGFRPIVLTGPDQVVVNGQLTLADETTGVLSLPYYDRHVRDAVATKTAESLVPDSF